MKGVPHPLLAFGTRRDWDRRKTAGHFGVPYGRFRKLVTGHEGVSFDGAKAWAERSEGEFSAMDVLTWHSANRRKGGDGEERAAG